MKTPREKASELIGKFDKLRIANFKYIKGLL
jgi:hypothetical protein